MSAWLEIKDLHAKVGDKPILNGLSLTIAAGETHVIMGPNGSGKSTLSNVLCGNPHYEVTGGSVEFKGQNLLEMSVEERARVGIFLAFKSPIEPMLIISEESKASTYFFAMCTTSRILCETKTSRIERSPACKAEKQARSSFAPSGCGKTLFFSI